MDSLPVQLVVVGLLVALNGVLAGSEIALVSLREGQLVQLERGGATQRLVARLAREPNRYLSTVQIGITLAGFLASAVAATTLADRLGGALDFLGGADTAVAVVLVTLALTYLNLAFGEIAPKRIAMQRAVGWSVAAARPLAALAAAATPVVWLLSRTTNLTVRALGGDPTLHRQEFSEEELRAVVMSRRGMSAMQRKILAGALEVGRLTVEQVMAPRTSVFALREETPAAEGLAALVAVGHTRAPVYRETLDDTSGLVHARDLVGADGPVRNARRAALALPTSMPVLSALSRLQVERQQMALVVDEHGGVAGIVTVEDLVEEIVGEIYDEFDPSHALVERVPDGALLVSGRFPAHDLPDIGVAGPPGSYRTVAGMLLDELRRLPREGDTVMLGDRRFTVAAVRGRAIERVRIEPAREPLPARGEDPGAR